MILYTSKDGSFSIRDTSIDDISLIHEFIKKLAIYEKLEHKMTATIASLTQSLFIDKHAIVLIASVHNKPIGFALYFYHFSTFLGNAYLYLEDLYIDQAYRHQGYGKQLFSFLAKLALDRGLERFDWMCLNWNQPSIRFYESLDAKPLSDWTTFRLDKHGLINLKKHIE